ncbi:MAG: ThuA domain-containing protein [Deltaproteobacteria bacterium]|nr:ThuA domain-containing protein [Deltaproteobacteria bacterium]MBW2359344.1 ThuA domain-containing protein [Deltaproteobacteria bacterium]
MTLVRRILIGLLALLGAGAAAGLALAWYVGAWNILFPSRAHDRVAPELPAQLARPAVLVFTKTNSFRHEDGIAAGVSLLQEISERRGWGFFHTENGAVFNADQLARFAAVVFHNASGDTLDAAQESAFQTWLEAGGGWVGTHSAGDGSHEDWRWYQDSLIGGLFIAHIMGPQFQEARVVVEDASHPAAAKLPADFSHREEWYSWQESARARGFHVILSIDETSYQPFARMFGGEKDLRMGDHPVVWSRCVGKGRALYSALGHSTEAYATDEHRALLEGAVAWAAGVEGEGCP